MTQHHLVIELHIFTEITLTRLGGGGLAIIHREAINVSSRNHNFVDTSFELQLVNIGLKSRDIVLANIYRPPSSSKSVFLDEFGLLLTNLGTDAVDRLMIYVAISTYLAPHPTRLITGWPSSSTQLNPSRNL